MVSCCFVSTMAAKDYYAQWLSCQYFEVLSYQVTGQLVIVVVLAIFQGICIYQRV